jgi:hypothetical protein
VRKPVVVGEAKRVANGEKPVNPVRTLARCIARFAKNPVLPTLRICWAMEVVGLLNLEPVVNPNRAVGTLTIGERVTTVGTVTGVLRVNDKLFVNWRLRLNDNPADAAVGARLNEVLLLNWRLRVNVWVPGVDANEMLLANRRLCVSDSVGRNGNRALAVRLNERLFVNCVLCVKFTDGLKGNWALGVRENDVLFVNCRLCVKFTDGIFMKGVRGLVKNPLLNGIPP